jgi:hypothetical protein
MMRALVIAAVLCFASSLSAQDHQHRHSEIPATADDARIDLLLAKARAATEPYQDRNVAIASGYRRVGPDFPSMGEHWLNTRLIVEGAFDVSRPQMLTYVEIAGRPVLTGVVYAIPLQKGESPPGAFGPEGLWHEHNGTVDEEGLVPEHHSTPSTGEGTRVSFLHAWIGIRRMDERFAAENWAIPFLRLGLGIPREFPNGASRALSLIAGGQSFFIQLLGESGETSIRYFDECTSIVSSVIAETRSQGRALSDRDLERLDEAWQHLVGQVAARSGIETAKRINGGKAPVLR